MMTARELVVAVVRHESRRVDTASLISKMSYESMPVDSEGR
jgi:hypothetical protein